MVRFNLEVTDANEPSPLTISDACSACPNAINEIVLASLIDIINQP
ncbi:hypothetical protein [Marinilactibacillus psychrotolerans]